MFLRILNLAITYIILLALPCKSIAVESFNQLPPDIQMRLEMEKYKVQLKDILSFEGIRDNILMGYGLVVGLSSTGDNLKNAGFTQKELENFLERLGINSIGASIKTKNVAAVTITATLPAFSRVGSKIDITVGTLGDAKSLMGGMLLPTPLLGADGEIYAIAQGNIVTGQTGEKKDAIYTTGYISKGAIVEKEIDFELNSLSVLHLRLYDPDITTAKNVEQAINSTIGNYARAIDPATIVLDVPQRYHEDVLSLLNEIEKLKVLVETPARVIIDAKSGVVIMNNNVRIGSVAIAKGNLTVSVGGRREDQSVQVSMLESNVTVKDLVTGLNALGLEPKELIEILQSIKSLGALHADIVTR